MNKKHRKRRSGRERMALLRNVLTMITVCTYLEYGVCVEEGLGDFKQVNASQCFCPGEDVVYECKINRTGFTRYVVAGTTCMGDRFLLPHTDFDKSLRIPCSTGPGGVEILAQSVGNDSNSFISIITITALQQNSNLTIECYYYDGTTDTQVGTTQFPTPTVPEAVTDIDYDNFDSTNHFSWNETSPPPPGCQDYLISSVNCGSCPDRTVNTFIDCVDDQPGIERNCSLSVTTSVCGVNETTTAPFLILSTSDPTTKATPSSASGMSAETIAGIVVGVVAVISIVTGTCICVTVIAVYYCKKRRLGCFAESQSMDSVELKPPDGKPVSTGGPGQPNDPAIDRGGPGQPIEQPGDVGDPGQPGVALGDLGQSEQQDVGTSAEETQAWQVVEQMLTEHGNQNDNEHILKSLQRVKQLVREKQDLQTQLLDQERKEKSELKRRNQDLHTQLDQERKKNKENEEEKKRLKEDKDRFFKELQKIAADKEAQEKRLNEVIRQLETEISTLYQRVADLEGNMEQERTERKQAIEQAIQQEKTEREKAMEQERTQHEIDMSNFQQKIFDGVSEIINNSAAVKQQRLQNLAQNVNVPEENPIDGSKNGLGIDIKTQAAGVSRMSYTKEVGSDKNGQGLTTLPSDTNINSAVSYTA